MIAITRSLNNLDIKQMLSSTNPINSHTLDIRMD